MAPRPAAIRLDRNELPFTPDLALLGDLLEQANRYPAGERQAHLTGLIAARTGCHAEEILLGAGSSHVLDLIWRATVTPGAKVVYAAPGFEMYPIYTRQRHGVPIEVPLTPALGPDLERIADIAQAEHPALVAVINPHAPSGVRTSPADLAEFVSRVPADTIVVFDEAYHEFDELADPRDSPTLATARPNIVVTRTFSKGYGLAGLRIGYAMANRELIARIAAQSMPFTVTDLACAAAAHRLTDHETHALRMTEIRAERNRLAAELRAAGLAVATSATNFVLLPGDTGLAAHLRRVGLAVSVSAIGTRVSVGTSLEVDALLTAVRDHAHQPA